MKFSCQRGKQDGKEKSKHSDFFQKYFFARNSPPVIRFS